MKANELRIGNLITVATTIQVIEGVYKDSIYTKSYTANVYETMNKVAAIPLTEKWLIKFGFKRVNGVLVLDFTKSTQGLRGHFVREGFSVALDEKSLFGDSESVSLKTLSHVHQLQNLYFALTGEELKIEGK